MDNKELKFIGNDEKKYIASEMNNSIGDKVVVIKTTGNNPTIVTTIDCDIAHLTIDILLDSLDEALNKDHTKKALALIESEEYDIEFYEGLVTLKGNGDIQENITLDLHKLTAEMINAIKW